MRVRLHSENSETMLCFLKGRLTNIPRRHHLADGQLSSLYAPSPSFSSFGASDVLRYSSCLFECTLTTVCKLPEYRSRRKYMYVHFVTI